MTVVMENSALKNGNNNNNNVDAAGEKEVMLFFSSIPNHVTVIGRPIKANYLLKRTVKNNTTAL